jgi:hypothetical protein
MDHNACWLLTDAFGETSTGGAARFWWGRGVNHTVWTSAIRGYHTDSVDVPYLLDPVFERLGPGARVWLSEAGDPHVEGAVRVASSTWTTLDEWRRPEWVGSTAETRIRLRFALLAAGAAQPDPETTARLRTMSLADLPLAARRLEEMCVDGCSRAPQAVVQATMAVRAAAHAEGSAAGTLDLVARRYPTYAWYAALAAECACADLTTAAEDAVRLEGCGILEPAEEPALV